MPFAPRQAAWEALDVPHDAPPLVAAALIAVWTLVGHAITNGRPDGDDHPYVGQLLLYVPAEVDPRFTDPGAWFNCSGTLVSPTIVV